ncbi:MAG: phosphate ABC transporter substrate-binding protein PstS [Acidobacteria bacterium]|nr:phosphate ABC transporter substrate-binding protein PstS [Acidobacteriota bacterium]
MVRRFAAASVLVVLGCACSRSPQPIETKGGAPSGVILINGAGATFPYPIYAKWFDEFYKANPNLRINYQSIGSGGGIRQLQAGTVDFGATDSPMTEEQMKQARSPVLHFPTVLGAVVPVYNLPGVTDLNFTGEALANIFLGRIKKWNAPELAGANPGVKLPARDVIVVHRSDGSGTTFVWTDYLSKASPNWKNKVGAGNAVNWPVGLGAKGNEGVTGMVKQTPDSIGYVELVYAIQNHIPYGKVRNSTGTFVKASPASVTAAAEGAAANIPDDFRVSITNAPGEGAYPISSFTWLLVPEKIEDEAKRNAITAFLRWMLADGQKMAEPLGYAPLPQQVASKELELVSKIQ